MTRTVGKRSAVIPAFDPAQGKHVVAAPGTGYGFWAGAPSIDISPTQGFALSYRVRRPRTEGRGGECRIALSPDGETFETVWSCTKDDLGAKSIEKSALVQLPDGRWRLYMSFEVADHYDRNPATWRVDVMDARTPDEFDPGTLRTVLDPAQLDLAFIKDPTVSIVGGQFLLYAAVGMPTGRLERPGDFAPYSRGQAALFTSHDGIEFSPGRRLLERPRDSWDGLHQRITGVVNNGVSWWAFYDGSRRRADGYDEFSGLAHGWRPDELVSLTPDEPWVRSPFASESVRYVDGVIVDERLHLFYEMAVGEGHHDLFHSVLDL